MTRLWPRLAAGPARVLYEELGEREVEDLARTVSLDHPRKTYVATGGNRVGNDEILDLVRELRSAAGEFGYPRSTDDRGRIDYDRAAAEILYRRMDMNTVEGADDQVWNFLALVAAPDLVRWRWPGSRNPERWISSDRTRHMFARLWWQALTFVEVGLDGRSNLSLLRSLTERDLNQITERRSIGGIPRLARAVARLARAGDATAPGGGDTLRRVMPPLRRRLSFIDFAGLSDDQIDDHLRALVADLSESEPGHDRSSGGAEGTGDARRPAGPVPTGVAGGSAGAPAPSAGARRDRRPVFVDLCAGAGGLALGLEKSGFRAGLLVDNRSVACETLRANRPEWDVREADLLNLGVSDFPDPHGIDLLAAGLPRVQGAATVGRLRGSDREIELLTATIELVNGLRPRAVLIDNVPALVTSDVYAEVRAWIDDRLIGIGYSLRWRVVDAAEHGVPQDRRHGVLVAFRDASADGFDPRSDSVGPPPTVGQVLGASMASRGWTQASAWADQADEPAPTIVGGSWDRGGPDLGPTGSKRSWARWGVDGGTVGDHPPGPDFRWDPAAGRVGLVRLTVEQVATLQGFPEDWKLAGGKTARYRQVAEATPPPLAAALGRAVARMSVGPAEG